MSPPVGALRALRSISPSPRYNPDGNLDTTFGSSGIVRTPLGADGKGHSRAHAIALDSQGRIVSAGLGGNGSSSAFRFQFALARHNTDGTLDTTFDGGIVRTSMGVANTPAKAVAIDSQGRIVAVGGSTDGSRPHFALTRHNPDGTLSGKTMTAVGSFSAEATAVAIDPQDRIVAGGYSWNGHDRDFALARYMEPAGEEEITLTAEGRRERGLHKADLSWSGARSDEIDVYRDGELIATVRNDGSHTDDIDRRGRATYTYQVCEAGTSMCSNEATVRFGGPPG